MLLQTNNIQKWFGQKDTKLHVLKGIDFEADKGEMVYIVGPSGSGKTTFLSIISGILVPDEGQVIVEGESLWQLSSDARSLWRLNRLGFVFQDFHLFPRLTCLENVAIPLLLRGTPWNQALERAASTLEQVGLVGKQEYHPQQMSTGQQQRVAIARALVGEPEILILDEPTASLDGEMGKNVMEFVRHNVLNDSRLVLVVTHDNRIAPYASRIVRLEDGMLSHTEGFQ